MPSRWLVNRFSAMDPEKRRVWAARLLIFTLVGWPATHVALQLLGQGSLFNHILNAISWWAVSLTAIDIIQTTDVKVDTSN
jgi:hypothetical protein